MACRDPKCGCAFVSETLNISEVSPGVWQFEQAEFSDITQLQDDVAQLQADLAALQQTVADGFDAQTADLDAGLLSIVPRRNTGTASAHSGIVGATVVNTLTLPTAPTARLCAVMLNLNVGKSVASDTVDVYVRINGANICRQRIGATVTNSSVSIGIMTATAANTTPTFSATVGRAVGSGTWTVGNGPADNQMQVWTFPRGIIVS